MMRLSLLQKHFMIKNLITLFICGLGFTPVCGQENQVPRISYIVKNSGDTLRGKISLKYRDESVKKVLYETSNGTLEKYGPKEVKEVFANGGLFKSEVIVLDKSRGELPLDIDTIFAEVLASADVNLLYYQDERGQDHFFLEDQNHMEELVVKTIHLDNFNERHLDVYKGQLKTRFKQCPSLFPEIESLAYKRSEMLKLFIKGCECIGQNLTMKSTNKKKSKIKWAVVAGFGIFTIGGLMWATKNHFGQID
jgi:hypothetical protein